MVMELAEWVQWFLAWHVRVVSGMQDGDDATQSSRILFCGSRTIRRWGTPRNGERALAQNTKWLGARRPQLLHERKPFWVTADAAAHAKSLMRSTDEGWQEQCANCLNFFQFWSVHDHQIMSLSEKEETVLTDRKEQLREIKKERKKERKKRKKRSETKNKWKEPYQELFGSGSTTCWWFDRASAHIYTLQSFVLIV